jgi:hypothetical protein
MRLYTYHDSRGTGKFVAYFIDDSGQPARITSKTADYIFEWCTETFGKSDVKTWFSVHREQFFFKKVEDLNWFVMRWS